MLDAPVAIITGGARRIGAAICKHLHANGFNIIIHYNQSKEDADNLASHLNTLRTNSATAIQADLNLLAEITHLATRTLSAWGRIDTLINNASTFYATSIQDAEEQDWNNLINSNLKAPFFLSQALTKELSKNKGCIINIADIFADKPMPNHSIYSIAKAGNKMLTQTLALELAPNIRVNSVAPGAILWPEDKNGNEIANTDKLKNIPLQSLGGAEAIAKAVYFLIQDSPYTTGQTIKVDGGRSLNQ